MYALLLRRPLTWLYFFCVVAYVGSEQGTADWISQFLSRYHGFDPHVTGATAVAYFWGLLTAGCLGPECLRYSAGKGTPRINSGSAGRLMAAQPNHGTGAIWIDVARLNRAPTAADTRPQRRPSGRARLYGCRWQQVS